MNTTITLTKSTPKRCALRSYNVHILPLDGGQNEYGRDWTITATSMVGAAKLARHRAEARGIGHCRYTVSDTRLSQPLAVWEQDQASWRKGAKFTQVA